MEVSEIAAGSSRLATERMRQAYLLVRLADVQRASSYGVIQTVSKSSCRFNVEWYAVNSGWDVCDTIILTVDSGLVL
jgi:hypothetical protein